MRGQKRFLTACSLIIVFSCAHLGVVSSAREAFEKGLGLFNGGKYEEAIPHFEKASQIDPDYSQAYFYLGRSYLNLGKWLESIPPLRTAFRLSPDKYRKEILTVLLDALIGGAVSEIKKGNIESSVGFLKEALQLKPEATRARDELVRALIAQGMGLLGQGNTTEAVAVFAEAVELSPDSVDAYIGLARALFREGDFQKALEAMETVRRIDPSRRLDSLLNEIFSR